MSVNKVILIGNVGKDPDVRYLENNVCVANFTLATTERGYTTQSGIQIPDKTEWHNIVVWRGLAELLHRIRPHYEDGRVKGLNYISKAKFALVHGKTKTRFVDTQPKFMSTIWNYWADATDNHHRVLHR